jgi:uncharacterized protein (TIGR02266 family)
MKAASAQARDRWRLNAALSSVSTAEAEQSGVSGTHAIGVGAAVRDDRSSPHVVVPSHVEGGEQTPQLQSSLSQTQAALSELRLERDELARRLDAALAEIARLRAAPQHTPTAPTPPERAGISVESSGVESQRPALVLSRVVVTSSLMSNELEVELLHDTHLVTGLEQDIAQGGLFVATYRTLPLGTRVALELELAEDRVLASGEVRWLRDEREDLQQRPGFGVAFVDLSPDAAAVLAQLCRAEPARYYEV